MCVSVVMCCTCYVLFCFFTFFFFFKQKTAYEMRISDWSSDVCSSDLHSFFQSLHQGTDTVPADFIGVVRPAHTLAGHHHALLANLLAQTQALACGEENEDGHRRYPGDRPSTVLLLDELNPESLGALDRKSTRLKPSP